MKNIFIIPTALESKLYKENDEFHFEEYPLKTVTAGNCYMYITNNEIIRSNDFILENGKPIVKCEKILDSKDLVWKSLDEKSSACDSILNFKKVILTIDPLLIADGVQEINNDLLNWFVNNNCEYVEVEKQYGCIELEAICDFGDRPCPNRPDCLKSKYKTTIPKEKSVEEIALSLYPKKEVKLNNGLIHDINELRRFDFILGAKWMEENSKNIYIVKKI